MEVDIENRAPQNDGIVYSEMVVEYEKETPTKSEEGEDVSSKEGTPDYWHSSSVNMRKMQKMFHTATEGPLFLRMSLC